MTKRKESEPLASEGISRLLFVKTEERELLQYALEHGMINVSYVQEQINMNKRKELLEKHPYKIWEGKNGNWYTYFPDEKNKRIKRERKSKSEIENLIIEYWKAKEENPTVEDLFEEWISRKQSRNMQNQTADRYRRDFKRYFSEISNRKIKKIDEYELDEFLTNTVFSNKMTAKSFSNMRILLRGIWNRARKKKLIDYQIDDVLDGLEISKNDFRKPEKKKQVYTDSEKKQMILYLEKNLDSCNLGLLFIFATGIRVGELASLKPEDISGNKIHISRTEISYESSKGKYSYEVRDFPKTEAGIRDIRIPKEFIFYLQLAKNRAANNKTWLFEKNGERIRTYQYQCRLRYICEKKLHIPVKSPHKIRKTYASALIDTGIPESLIIEQMGHTNISTTKKHYYDNRFDSKEMDAIFSKLNILSAATQN